MAKIESNIIRVISSKQTFLDRLANGDISNNAFVYIEETLEIWHNYKYYGSLLELTAALTAEINRAKAAEEYLESRLLFRNIKVDINTGQLYLFYEAETPDEGDDAIDNEVYTLDDSGEYLNITTEEDNNVLTNNI